MIVRVGGLGSFIPRLSTTVSDPTEVPASGNVIIPELSAVLVFGVAPGKYHWDADTEPEAVAPKFESDWPAVIVMSLAGAVIMPLGG